MSNFINRLIVASVCLLSASVYAESGLYIGTSVGNAKVGVKSPQKDDLSFDLEDSDLGYKVYGGFKFTMIAIEGGYVNFGVIEGNSGTAKVKGLNAFAVLSTGIGPVDVFAKAGGFIWETDYKIAEDKYKEDGFDPALGLGASIQLGNMAVRAEYEYYKIKGLNELSMLSAGVTFWLF